MVPLKQFVEVVGAAIRSVFELCTFCAIFAESARKQSDTKKICRTPDQARSAVFQVGQIFSTRPDVLPKEYIATLERLQEHVPPMPFSEVEAVVRGDFNGRPVGEVFKTFERTAIASASFAQVHFATLETGEQVAVKIQRHGVDAQMRRGLSGIGALIVILRFAAPPVARAYNVRNAFAEFRRYTLQELDFTIEARTMVAFRQNFILWPDVVIPKPFLPYVTKRVLTMERATGERVDVVVKRLTLEGRQVLGRRAVSRRPSSR